MKTKTCYCCLTEKPLEDFHKNPGMTDGRLGICKQCQYKQHKQRKLEQSPINELLSGWKRT